MKLSHVRFAMSVVFCLTVLTMLAAPASAQTYWYSTSGNCDDGVYWGRTAHAHCAVSGTSPYTAGVVGAQANTFCPPQEAEPVVYAAGSGSTASTMIWAYSAAWSPGVASSTYAEELTYLGDFSSGGTGGYYCYDTSD